MDILRATGRSLKNTAVIFDTKKYTYQQLIKAADSVKGTIKISKGSPSSKYGPSIGIYAAPGPEYVAGTWGSWLVGGIAVPLATSHPYRELDYVIKDAGISTVLVSESNFDKVKDVAHANGVQLSVIEESVLADSPAALSDGEWSEEQVTSMQPAPTPGDGALIMYTSGTTGKPKGVLHTHRSVMAQVRCLTESWQWAANDHILHALPLHHTHGIINALYCALYNGATVEMLPKFSPSVTWNRLKSGDVSVFMGVPTMYTLLLNVYDGMSEADKAQAQEAARNLRLTISGSAACPVPIMNRWKEISGQTLLERYGMTETGMILSNPYEGERRAGSVGLPLPGVEVRLVADAEAAASTSGQDASTLTPGEIRVKGANLFQEYWYRPEATAEAFDEEGWFRTGDTAVLEAGEGTPEYYRILGRTSVDIIKSGGYKIGALHIENVLLEHPQVAECAVLGLPDDTYGEVVSAILVAKKSPDASSSDTGGNNGGLDFVELRQFCGQSLPPYQVPKVMLAVDSIPRNAMGKVNKKELLGMYRDQLTAGNRGRK